MIEATVLAMEDRLNLLLLSCSREGGLAWKI